MILTIQLPKSVQSSRNCLLAASYSALLISFLPQAGSSQPLPQFTDVPVITAESGKTYTDPYYIPTERPEVVTPGQVLNSTTEAIKGWFSGVWGTVGSAGPWALSSQTAPAFPSSTTPPAPTSTKTTQSTAKKQNFPYPQTPDRPSNKPSSTTTKPSKPPAKKNTPTSSVSRVEVKPLSPPLPEPPREKPKNSPQDRQETPTPPQKEEQVVQNNASSEESKQPAPPKDEVPFATPAETKGHVISPFPPYRELDVSAIKAGGRAIDPESGKIFRVP